MISFFVPGQPKGQPRPRAFARRFGATWTARVYDPGTAEGWKSAIAIAAKEHIQNPHAGPLLVTLEFFLQRPKAHFLRGVLRENSPHHHTGKPDVDNLAKAVLDALTTIVAWSDDAIISELHVRKRYADEIGNCGCRVCIGHAWVPQTAMESMQEPLPLD